MLSPSLSHAHALGRLRPFLCQVISILLVSTTSLMSQQSPAQKPANPTSGSKVAEGKSAEEKPQPDESASAMAALAQLNNALEGLAAKVSPAVVQILVTGYGPLHEETRTQTALIVRQHAVGSGVIVDSSGYIMTNAHVVEGAQRIRVALPLPGDSGRAVPVGKRHILEARLVGVHKDTDLALLKIDEKDLPTLPLLSQQRPRVGQLVFAIGSPEGLQNSVTMGVVSAVAR
ncbi:MAG: trypsin-like peptidase domain-containing protein, partial [Candidatus Sulfotelmatobacter sp.]